MYRIIVLLILYIFLGSCASVSTQSENVLVTSQPKRIEGCQFMGQVESSSILVNIKANGVAFDNAMHELKNEAKRMGANVVLMSTRSNPIGEAYKCN
jgi:hypothetical protein